MPATIAAPAETPLNTLTLEGRQRRMLGICATYLMREENYHPRSISKWVMKDHPGLFSDPREIEAYLWNHSTFYWDYWERYEDSSFEEFDAHADEILDLWKENYEAVEPHGEGAVNEWVTETLTNVLGRSGVPRQFADDIERFSHRGSRRVY